MNSSETNPKKISEKLSVDLDGLRLVQTEQDYLSLISKLLIIRSRVNS